jgi:hypothetical protein
MFDMFFNLLLHSKYSLGDQQAQQPVLHAISKFKDKEEIGAIQIKNSVKQAVVASGVPT